MSFWVIPVRMKPVEAHMHADRRLAFQVLTAFGARQQDGGSATVLRDEGDRKLVEFRSTVPTLFGRQKVYRTVERVTLKAPETVTFEGVEGPLSLLNDRFVLSKANDCTWFTYESTVGVKGWLAGWLIAWLYVRPLLSRFMREHTLKLKQTIEERARNSKVYPQRVCSCEAAPEPAR
ncbi:MAG: hypothetical protein HY682_10420 [Chloroflexi bacterium]|nr:hypothetical protein [Chloroflexota bacterium]